ncbi:hypothetical protein GP486_000828 [Trichoglossum hirsutum]|uniref:Uncharacterized protein n=1 Tax=Trichoglossum hirsutum TaxID=265104 RepID=A0A9P8RT73_9PEZI|nr:hypothetical protein GP486_000828 [Trichoglossum hirsutum]
MELYTPLVQCSVLSTNDTFELARLLHNRYRAALCLDDGIAMRAAKDSILNYVQILIEDLRRQKIPPHPMASLHILSYCKESYQLDIGVDFWEWILNQDHGFMDARTYGAGIELLAYYGKPLHYLESLYAQALKRYPGAFSEYHLSPQSIVKDTSRPSNAPGSRMILLQGILTARAIYGDWRNAYLALDTALRLYPDQVPSRFYELFIYKRPTTESFKVFHVACRNGCPPTKRTFTYLLTELAKFQSRRRSVLGRVHILNCMLTSLQAYSGAGGKVVVWHLNKIVQSVLQVLPAMSPPTEEAKAYEPLYKTIFSAMELLIVILSELGTPANSFTFNAIISMGGTLGRPDLITNALRCLLEADLEPNALTRRCLLVAAGKIGDADGVEAAWHSIVKSAAESNPEQDLDALGTQINVADWVELAKAGKRIGNDAFVKEQFTKYKVRLPQSAAVKDKEPRQIQADPDTAEKTDILHEKIEDTPNYLMTPSMDQLPTIMQSFDGIFAKLNGIRNLVNDPKAYSFCDSPLPIALSSMPESSDEIPDSEYRDLYEALSTDTSFTRPKEKETVDPQTSTGFTFAELRYQNWKVINQLLVESERYENIKASEIDQALKSGNPLVRHERIRRAHWVGESKILRDSEGHDDSKIPAWIAQILRLREVDVETYISKNQHDKSLKAEGEPNKLEEIRS